MKKTQLMVVLWITGMFACWSGNANAQTAWLDVGIKGSIGGNYLSNPDSFAADGYAALPFDDGAGGIGGGGGLFVDLRVLKQYLGLEIGMMFEGNRNWCSITYNDVVKTHYIYTHSAMRIPFLIKGNLTKGGTRVSLGIGPEILVGLNASTDIEVVDGKEWVSDSDLQNYQNAFGASSRTDVALAADLGLAFKVWKLAITLDFRFSYNLTMPTDYTERMGANWTGGQYNIQGANTLDGRILLGLAYMFEFGN